MIDITGWKVDNGFNCYVDVHPACNATCPFCIAETVGRTSGPLFFDGLEYTLELVEKLNGTIQVVGGEPMISRRLTGILELMEDYRFHRVVVNTNGTITDPGIFDKMKRAGVTHVNLSRHHYDENLNQKIMNIRPKLDNDKFRGVVDAIKNTGVHVRVQACLIKGYIDSLPEIVNYLDWCKSIGVNDVSFSQMFPLKEFDYQLEPVAGYTEEMQVNMAEIIRGIWAQKKYKSIRGPSRTTSHGGGETTAWGNRNRRRFWKAPNGVSFSIKTLLGYDTNGSPLTNQYVKTQDAELAPGRLAFAVLHADGRLTASWDRRERVIYVPTSKPKTTFRNPLCLKSYS